MSVLTLNEAKNYLVVVHDADDDRIQQLIEDAEDECVQYLDRSSLPRIGQECPDECDTGTTPAAVSDASDLPRSLRRGILLIVQGGYEGKDADEMMKLRAAAEVCWHPYRCNLGA